METGGLFLWLPCLAEWTKVDLTLRFPVATMLLQNFPCFRQSLHLHNPVAPEKVHQFFSVVILPQNSQVPTRSALSLVFIAVDTGISLECKDNAGRTLSEVACNC